MNKRFISWDEFFELLKPWDQKGNLIYGVPKGGMIATGFLMEADTTVYPGRATIILDDLVDSGATRGHFVKEFPHIPFHALIDKQKEGTKDWIVFPWEADHPMGEDSIQQNIVRQLQYIGEDPTREGLLETPDRIVKSWDEIYSGYKRTPDQIMKTFDADGHDEIVLAKNIEFYSMCEHHMLPFFGKAHVAYIPNKKIIGVSKLARLVDIYAKRLQIQERLADQVVLALMNHLNPVGAACIIEAAHMCMRMRGVSKQESLMTTSSMKGAFLDKPAARSELMQLIKG